MTKQKLKEKFLELRIAGETYESIAKKLSVSKQTLINWNQDYSLKEAITIAELINYQAILKTHKQNRLAKIEYFAELCERAKEEVSKRDLSEISIERLFKIILDSEDRISNLIPKIFSGETKNGLSPPIDPSFFFDPEH